MICHLLHFLLYLTALKFHGLNITGDSHLITGVIFNDQSGAMNQNPAVPGLELHQSVRIQNNGTVIFYDHSLTADKR